MTSFDPQGRCTKHSELGCVPCLQRDNASMREFGLALAEDFARKANDVAQRKGIYYAFTDEALIHMAKEMVRVFGVLAETEGEP